MSVYDKNGNIISGSGDVKTAFMDLVASGEINLGSAVGATLTYNGLTDAWITNGTTQYNAMKARYKELANRAIPFFISTDQHSSGLEAHRWVNNIDRDGLDMANINLGDTVLDTFSASALESWSARVKQVKNYIGVVGNHDTHKGSYTGSDPNLIPNVYDLTRFFNSTYDRVVADGNHASYVVYDNEHNVKYIVSDNYIHGADGTMISNMDLSSEYCDWLIGELTKDDYDIVFLQHWTLHSTGSHNEYTNRDGVIVPNITGQAQLRVALAGRKAKTTGNIVDYDGNTHAYDFSNMKHNLLCMLTGHWHEECFAKLDGVLCYSADWLGNDRSCVFGLVDRVNDKLRIWKFGASTVYDELVLDL